MHYSGLSEVIQYTAHYFIPLLVFNMAWEKI